MAVNGVFDKEELKLFLDRIDSLEESIATLKEDLKDVWKDAKAAGFDTHTMKRVRVLLKMDSSVREEKESLYEVYKEALGLDFSGTPLGASIEGAGTGEALPPVSDELREAPARKRPISNAMSSIPGVDGEPPQKRRPGRPRKVRDPSDGALVTVPANGADSIADASAS